MGTYGKCIFSRICKIISVIHLLFKNANVIIVVKIALLNSKRVPRNPGNRVISRYFFLAKIAFHKLEEN